jgi:hypothetical protein
MVRVHVGDYHPPCPGFDVHSNFVVAVEARELAVETDAGYGPWGEGENGSFQQVDVAGAGAEVKHLGFDLLMAYSFGFPPCEGRYAAAAGDTGEPHIWVFKCGQEFGFSIGVNNFQVVMQKYERIKWPANAGVEDRIVGLRDRRLIR